MSHPGTLAFHVFPKIKMVVSVLLTLKCQVNPFTNKTPEGCCYPWFQMLVNPLKTPDIFLMASFCSCLPPCLVNNRIF